MTPLHQVANARRTGHTLALGRRRGHLICRLDPQGAHRIVAGLMRVPAFFTTAGFTRLA